MIISSTPLVSVLMLTYNHAGYISEAINGVLAQKTTFNFELMIFNDNSLDLTDKIILDIISNHENGERIKYFKHVENIGVSKNAIFALKQAKGKYIALCEGDDYWTDPYKLQKQVDFLEVNQGYSECFHEVSIEYEDGAIRNYTSSPIDRDYNFQDFLQENKAATCSIMFRREALNPTFYEGLRFVKAGDWYLNLHLSLVGKVKFLSSNMGVYRRHSGGIWSSQDERLMPYKELVLLVSMIPLFEKENSEFFIKEFEKKMEQLSNRFKETNEALSNCFELNHNKTTKINRINNYLQLVLSSRSYRLGHFLLAPMRYISRLIKIKYEK